MFWSERYSPRQVTKMKALAPYNHENNQSLLKYTLKRKKVKIVW